MSSLLPSSSLSCSCHGVSPSSDGSSSVTHLLAMFIRLHNAAIIGIESLLLLKRHFQPFAQLPTSGIHESCSCFRSRAQPPLLSFLQRGRGARSHSRCTLVEADKVSRINSMEVSGQTGSRVAEKLWGSCRREALDALYHPFVVSLAAGTLPMASFQQYVVQDAYFLEAFSRAYGVAMESTEDQGAKATIDSLRQAVCEELQMHSSLAEAWGVDLTKEQHPNSATVAYTKFLLDTANGGPEELCHRPCSQGDEASKLQATSSALGSLSSYIIAAMTPCMRLYAFLGQEIERCARAESNHPYQEWIDTYSSADFEALASKIENLLDTLTSTLQGEGAQATLKSLYQRAMTLEVAFFSAQSVGPVNVPFFKCGAASERRLVLVSDFDSTCTIADSCPVLADLSVHTAETDHVGNKAEATRLREKWDALVMQYMDEYEELVKQNLPVARKDAGQFLTKMSAFERRANLRVEDAGVLKGLSLANIHDSGRLMPLREGCSDLMRRLCARDANIDVHIISVCWSKTFIEGAFQKGGFTCPNIHANELAFHEGVSTGKIVRDVVTAADKQKRYFHILGVTPPWDIRGDEGIRSVYLGDSITDLLCLVRADVGIVLGNSSSLKQVYGDYLRPLYMYAIQSERENGSGGGRRCKRGVLYTVSSWHEVEAFLLGTV